MRMVTTTSSQWNLSNEVLLMIVRNIIEKRDICSLALVSRQFYLAINASRWRHLDISKGTSLAAMLAEVNAYPVHMRKYIAFSSTFPEHFLYNPRSALSTVNSSNRAITDGGISSTSSQDKNHSSDHNGNKRSSCSSSSSTVNDHDVDQMEEPKTDFDWLRMHGKRTLSLKGSLTLSSKLIRACGVMFPNVRHLDLSACELDIVSGDALWVCLAENFDLESLDYPQSLTNTTYYYGVPPSIPPVLEPYEFANLTRLNITIGRHIYTDRISVALAACKNIKHLRYIATEATSSQDLPYRTVLGGTGCIQRFESLGLLDKARVTATALIDILEMHGPTLKKFELVRVNKLGSEQYTAAVQQAMSTHLTTNLRELVIHPTSLPVAFPQILEKCHMITSLTLDPYYGADFWRVLAPLKASLKHLKMVWKQIERTILVLPKSDKELICEFTELESFSCNWWADFPLVELVTLPNMERLRVHCAGVELTRLKVFFEEEDSKKIATVKVETTSGEDGGVGVEIMEQTGEDENGDRDTIADEDATVPEVGQPSSTAENVAITVYRPALRVWDAIVSQVGELTRYPSLIHKCANLELVSITATDRRQKKHLWRPQNGYMPNGDPKWERFDHRPTFLKYYPV